MHCCSPPLPLVVHLPSCLQEMMSTPRFRCYRTNDVTGVELGGALKNVLAIGERGRLVTWDW